MNFEKNRRQFLSELLIATTLLPLTSAAWAKQELKADPFNLGIASGSPTHNSVVLWTRLFYPNENENENEKSLGRVNIPVKWEIAFDEEFQSIVKSGISQAVAGLAHSVHAEVEGLPSNKWFYYRFKVGSYVSKTGKTRTFALPNTPILSLKIAFGSCQNFEVGYFNSYPHLVEEKPDLMIFLGDYIYEYPTNPKWVRSVNSGWCLNLEDYRNRYEIYKQDKDLQSIHAACPWLITWDDHEVMNDYAGKQPGLLHKKFPNFAKRRAEAYQAFYEHLPIKSSAITEGIQGLYSGAEMRLYDNYSIGSLVNINLLDGRQYRTPQKCNEEGKVGAARIDPLTCREIQDENHTFLGHEQEKWLENQFKTKNNQKWTIIAQPLRFGECIVETKQGEMANSDGWDGYPLARKRIINQLIDYKVPNPVVIGGDAHEYWVGHIKENYNNRNSKNIGVEFCGTSICSFDGFQTIRRQKRNPHFVYANGERKGYTILEINEKQMIAHLRVSLNHKVPVAAIETLASFRVVAGVPKINKV